MEWIKHGRIFNPHDHSLPNGCISYAQSPQVLLFDDFLRIYFSTRSIDVNGKFLSHIAFVDMKKNFRDIVRVSTKTVIPLGSLGCFDEHGIFPINVIRHRGLIYGYTCGWNRRKSVSVDTSIGLVISNDNGLTFKRMGDGPILTSSLKEPQLVGDAFVMVINEVFHMWYIFGTGWRTYRLCDEPDRTYKIGHATSSNGINWTKEEGRQIISDELGPNECQALPSVVKIGELYHMYFCYRESFDFRKTRGRGYRIGHAISENLRDWKRIEDTVKLSSKSGEWDSDMQCYPHIFKCNNKIYLLYNGNDFGKYGFGLAELVL